MQQLHKRLSIETTRLILDWYEQKLIDQHEVLAKLGIKRRRFFTLLKQYRQGTLTTLVPPRTNAHRRLAKPLETVIREELTAEQRLIADPQLPVRSYNYQAIRDTVVERTGLSLSAQTVRNRAKAWGYYLPKASSASKHTRVVLTAATGLLLQHDSSHHKWSPYAETKWCLITTIDDYSRLLLFADLFEEETAWAHIIALQHVMQTYGVGSNYYTDNHSIFRFVEQAESYWYSRKVTATDVKTQWERAVRACGMGNIYALSPEAKGKVERPYRWLQDRVVRTCAKKQITTLDQARAVLKQEVERYNMRQVHSTTREIPLVRFERAAREGNSVFRPLTIPEPYTSLKDIFCLQEERVVNGYSNVVWNRRFLNIPRSIPVGARVTLHIIPDSSRPEIRVWYKEALVASMLLRPTGTSIPAPGSTQP